MLIIVSIFDPIPQILSMLIVNVNQTPR